MTSRVGIFASAFIVVLAACGSGSTETGPAKTWPILDVAVSDNEYTPADITVHVGQTVRWTYGGRNQHDLQIAEDVAGFGVSLEDFSGANGKYTFTFAKRGTFIYFCSIHGTRKGGGMAGTIRVKK